MGKFTISMVIFNSYVKLPEGNHWWQSLYGFVLKFLDLLKMSWITASQWKIHYLGSL
jgi:hypothetical protein